MATVTKPPILDDTGQDILTQLRRIADAKESNLMGYGGAVMFADLPAATSANLGLFYLIKDSFTTDARFVVGAGVSEPAGKYWAVINIGTGASPVCKYDELGTLVDLSDKQDVNLSSSMTIGGITQTTVEGALGGLNTAKQDQTMSSAVVIGGTSQTTVEGAIGGLNSVKQDKTLSSSMTIGGTTQTTVEGALGGLNSVKQNSTMSSAVTIGVTSQTTVEGAIGGLNTEKVDIKQGSANAGKILIVDSSGNLVLDNAPTEDIIGSATFLSGASTCAVSISLESGVYSLNYYTTNSEVTVKDELSSYASGVLTVTFRNKPNANGTMYIVARKVG